MKLFKLTIAVLAIAPFLAVAGSAESHRNCRAHPGGQWQIDPAEYVVRNCAFCHGEALQGKAVAPRLAGQHRDYIVYQFERFSDKSRNNPFSLKFMSHVAAKVLPIPTASLAPIFRGCLPRRPRTATRSTWPRAKTSFCTESRRTIFRPASSAMARKRKGTGKFPRLGGQSYYYLKRRLEQWAEGYAVVSPHMPGIVGLMTPDEIEAVASYLSFQEAAPSRGEF